MYDRNTTTLEHHTTKYERENNHTLQRHINCSHEICTNLKPIRYMDNFLEQRPSFFCVFLPHLLGSVRFQNLPPLFAYFANVPQRQIVQIREYRQKYCVHRKEKDLFLLPFVKSKDTPKLTFNGQIRNTFIRFRTCKRLRQYVYVMA